MFCLNINKRKLPGFDLNCFSLLELLKGQLSQHHYLKKKISTAKCIDSYTEQSVRKAENPDEDITIDPRLEAIVDRMFKRCFDDGKYKQVSSLRISYNFSYKWLKPSSQGHKSVKYDCPGDCSSENDCL